MERSARGAVWLWLAALVCPCHFPLWVLLALGGTAAGAALRAQPLWLYAGSGILCIGCLLAGLRRSRATARTVATGVPATRPGGGI